MGASSALRTLLNDQGHHALVVVVGHEELALASQRTRNLYATGKQDLELLGLSKLLALSEELLHAVAVS